MTQINLQRVRYLRQQLKSETSHVFTDWKLVQKLLDELIDNHQQYKQFALKKNITPYS